jgi:uncharacterized membrane protein YidH (DUF202 family)
LLIISLTIIFFSGNIKHAKLFKDRRRQTLDLELAQLMPITKQLPFERREVLTLFFTSGNISLLNIATNIIINNYCSTVHYYSKGQQSSLVQIVMHLVLCITIRSVVAFLVFKKSYQLQFLEVFPKKF